MSAAHRARWTLVPGTRLWTPKEDEKVRVLVPSQDNQGRRHYLPAGRDSAGYEDSTVLEDDGDVTCARDLHRRRALRPRTVLLPVLGGDASPRRSGGIRRRRDEAVVQKPRRPRLSGVRRGRNARRRDTRGLERAVRRDARPSRRHTDSQGGELRSRGVPPQGLGLVGNVRLHVDEQLSPKSTAAAVARPPRLLRRSRPARDLEHPPRPARRATLRSHSLTIGSSRYPTP